MPSVGERAPEFSLPSTDGKVRLSDMLRDGRVLLAFYFQDATPACSIELATLKDVYEPLRELGAAVVAISVDSLESHRAFAERLGGLPFALASDADLTVARAYDAVLLDDEERAAGAARVVVIEQNGVIAYAANPYSPNSLAQLEGALRALGVAI